MTNVSDVLTPVEAFPDEVDSRKRQWLQAFHPPVEQMNAPQFMNLPARSRLWQILSASIQHRGNWWRAVSFAAALFGS